MPLLSPDRWKTLEPIIDAAIDLAPEDRRAYVREACAGDSALEADVEFLLAEYDRPDVLLDHPAAERFPSLVDEATRPSGLLDGRYRIERELGRGGMATVYLARDLRHDRNVAVKVLHSDFSAALGVERFLAEIRVTAKLQHPHILPLHDSGQADGFLFYVMPYVEGQSLRQRLEKEKRLSIDEATRITREIASALDAAHREGIVHRDIKPENILFSNGAALVADFGIALAMSEAAPRLTKSGLVLGTPQYMSPEQATGDAPIDSRTDVYALGSVMFEMLAGEPPFTGATVSAVLAKRSAVPAPPVKVLRATVSEAMDAAVARALARESLDRFATAGEFGQALERSLEPVADQKSKASLLSGSKRPSRLQRRPLAIIGSIVGAMAAISLAWAATRASADNRTDRFTTLLQGIGLVDAPLDTSAYVVLADRRNDITEASPDVAEALRNALRRWRELNVPDGASIAAAAARNSSGPRTQYAHNVASSLGAGRYLRTDVTRSDDSLDISAELFDTRSDARLAQARIRVAAGRAIADAAMESLANALLFRDAVPRFVRSEGDARTASRQARAAFLRGQVALEAGNFVRADSEFFTATRFDSLYPQALVWLAHVRSWTNSRARPWTQLPQQAIQAVAQRGRLAPGDSMLLEALRALAAEHAEQACPIWSRLTTLEPNDYAAWYGLGNCLRRDGAVVRDAGSPSHWRFRSSYEVAMRALEMAFRLRPSVLHGFGGRSIANLQLMFFTSSASHRAGYTVAPDTQRFLGIPTWRRDSLVFVPIPEADIKLAPLPEAVVVAIQHQRERFLAIARMWRVEFPDNADAAEAVSVALEMLGNPAALDTLRRARALAANSDDSLRIAAAEVFSLTKFAIPSDRIGLVTARTLADSLLGAHTPAQRRAPQILASLAALTGRAQLAAAYAAAGGLDGGPQPIAQSGPALLAFAALGGPPDSLQSLEEQVENGVRNLPPADARAERSRWLARAATLAFPDYRLRSLSGAERDAFPDASLVAAASIGDSAAVRRGVTQIAAARRWIRPADITIDGVLPEAAALSSIGDTRAAAAWLDPTLNALRFSSSQDLVNVARAGALVRSMVLRADLAERLNDVPTARRFSAAAVILWSGADPFLKATVRRMEALGR